MTWVAVGVTAAGVVAGKMKNDRAQEIESSDRKLAAETQRYSPWTGMQAGKINRANSAMGDMFSGGLSGAMMGQSLSKGMAGAPDASGKMAGGGMAGGGMAGGEVGGGMAGGGGMNSLDEVDYMNTKYGMR